VYAAAQQLVYTALAIGSGVIAFLSYERGDDRIATGAAIASAAFLLFLVASRFAARRWKRSD
jgi:hypothetical protein